MNDKDNSIVILIILFFVIGVLASSIYYQVTESDDVEVIDDGLIVIGDEYERGELSGVKTNLVAVDDRGRGTVSPVWVDAEYGNGRVLVNIENLFFWVDTQFSIRLASQLAPHYLGLDRMDYDITYTIDIESPEVGGASAGAPMTVATVAALDNRTLNDDVAMTGTINQHGEVGRVGGIAGKTEAAAEAGFEKFLIPLGQSEQTVVETEIVCDDFLGIEICREREHERTFNVDEEYDIDVVEVSDLDEALEHYVE